MVLVSVASKTDVPSKMHFKLSLSRGVSLPIVFAERAQQTSADIHIAQQSGIIKAEIRDEFLAVYSRQSVPIGASHFRRRHTVQTA